MTAVTPTAATEPPSVARWDRGSARDAPQGWRRSIERAPPVVAGPAEPFCCQAGGP
ncbi:hypothetical protein [Kitasatospora sp. NPDC056181]|uniref:hypothetical protein n=1 Tax=Kitasatospora sp. NPDC056181 TaxID=3345737 RepID=UPI0035E39E73